MSIQEKLTALADAIRAKTGGTGTLTLDEMAAAVSSISAGGTETLPEVSAIEIGGITPSYGVSLSYGDDNETFYIQLKSDVGDAAERGIIDSGTEITMRAPIENFGDATAADVAAGKTFTSTAGLKVTGTHACSGGGMTTKSGTATSAVIETGLSSVSGLVMYRKNIDTTGLVYAVYDNGSSSYIYSVGSNGTCATGSDTCGTTDGGTFSWNGSGSTALVEGDTYYWIAWGEQ